MIKETPIFYLSDTDSIPKISCIYLLCNKVNNKKYIGKAKNLKERIKHHIYRSRLKFAYPLYNAIKKYGIENFYIEILERCGLGVILDREAHYIKLFNSTKIGYNVLERGFDRTGVKHTQETIDRIKKSTKENSIKGADHWTHKDPLRNISKAHIANAGRKRPEHCVENIRKYWTGRKREYLRKPIRQIDKKTGEVIKVWPSLGDAVVGMGKIDSGGIRAVITGKLNQKGYRQNTAFGYKWEYV